MESRRKIEVFPEFLMNISLQFERIMDRWCLHTDLNTCSVCKKKSTRALTLCSICQRPRHAQTCANRKGECHNCRDTGKERDTGKTAARSSLPCGANNSSRIKQIAPVEQTKISRRSVKSAAAASRSPLSQLQAAGSPLLTSSGAGGAKQTMASKPPPVRISARAPGESQAGDSNVQARQSINPLQNTSTSNRLSGYKHQECYLQEQHALQQISE
ncbi:hypothetical protein QAD02_021814 [Eretmocerus hayati]|uniref:Uncharacterized protein n=1 Tax=Eretmocerus hayati TaxID=131215 RepID=A0ACC2PT88_9HYME|nr:hypothetical protein QAD02_021814 [Eretmocerus hayati]